MERDTSKGRFNPREAPERLATAFPRLWRLDPIDHLDAPSKFEGRTATIEGRVDLRWKGVHGGRMYFVYMSKDNGATWEQVGMVSQGRHTVTGLASGTLYSFRVSAVGSVGEGPVSETVVAKAA